MEQGLQENRSMKMMLHIFFWSLLVLLQATSCTGSKSTQSSPGTGNQTPVCVQLEQKVNTELGQVNTCSQDSDCTQGSPPLRLNDACNDLTYNGSKNISQLEDDVDNYNETCPATDPSMVCPGVCTDVTCSSGICTGGC